MAEPPDAPRAVRRPGRAVFDVLSGIAGYAFASARDFFFPPLCVSCGASAPREEPFLCARCFAELEKNRTGRDPCPRCGQNLKVRQCTCEFAWDHPFERAVSLFDFDDTVRAVAHQIKYRGGRDLARRMGRYSPRWLPPGLLDEVDTVTAVPLHRSRQRRRGYNQAAELARGLCGALGGRIGFEEGLIRRVRATKTQTKLGREARTANLAKAFAPGRDAARAKGIRVLLIDDVITTGATAGACAEVLLGAGAVSVIVLSLARD